MNKEIQNIIIYTDGACSGNPGAGGWGTLLVDTKSSKVFEMGEHLRHTTNNETELLALLEGIRKLSELSLSKDIHIYVYLDSEYVRNGVTKWMKGWKQKGWVTSTGSEVKNKELWTSLSEELELFKKVQIDYIHVDGHVGVVGNERVNDIAQGFSKKDNVKLFEGSLSKYSITIEQLFLSVTAPLAQSSHAHKTKSSSKNGWYLSILDGVYEKHTTWAACEARVKGKKAFFKKVTTEEEEKNWVKKYLTK